MVFGRTTAIRPSAYLWYTLLYHIYAPFSKRKGEKIMNIQSNLAENLDMAKRHILFHHDPADTDGWITLAKKDAPGHRFRQRHYQPQELAEHLTEWTGEDVYYSQNTFFKPQRRIDNIRQLRSLFVDLDVYNLGMDPEWALGKLEFEYFGQCIPEPNMVIFSGRGLVLIWNIVPVPKMAMPLWRAVENFLNGELKAFGADAKASDPARIFRLPGTINSKSYATVKAQYRHAYRYDIHDLQYEYLPELTPPPPSAPKKKGRKSKVIQLFNLYTLHFSRALDIAKLVELREGDVTSYREYICFLYRYFTCCHTSDPTRALEETLDLNSEFTRPLSENEVRTATKSAEKAWEAKSNKEADAAAKALGYPGAGYSLTNKKLIDWLDITPEEQRELLTIIGPQEKRRRNRLAMEKTRREEGVRPMAEYNAERKKAVESKADRLKSLMLDNPTWTNAQYAEEMEVTVRTIQRLKAGFKKQS